MNTVRIVVITIWVSVGVCGYLSLRATVTDEARPAQAVLAQSTNIAASNRAVGPRAQHAPDLPPLDQAREPALEPDTSDLTQPLQTPHHVLDVLNADIGPQGEHVDPATLAAMLRSDPELARLLKE